MSEEKTLNFNVTVTTTQELVIKLPARFSDPEVLEEWNKTLWPISGPKDVATYAAGLVARGLSGWSHDGIGHLQEEVDRAPSDDEVFYVEEYYDQNFTVYEVK